MNKKRMIFLLLVLIASLLTLIFFVNKNSPSKHLEFDGDSAFQFLLEQTKYGPRTPGSLSHQLTRKMIKDKLTDFGWSVETQEMVVKGHTLYNIIAHRESSGPVTLIGTHYDSRLLATEENCLAHADQAVPGANDGASGVAVLLELARTLPLSTAKQVELVFFDAEDQGHIDDWDWILGSRAYVQNMQQPPARVVILDMIGDADLQIYKEKSSDPILNDQIWQAASELGYSDVFQNETKYNILDDHFPFIEKGIPAVDIIDFDYPWWHTISDTNDKVSPASLEIVGKTITHWLETNP